jgi:LAO/AO transport system kinase
MDLVADVLAGKRLAIARLLTLIENEDPGGLAALDRLFPHTGRAILIGVTGAPGAGKSSLVNQLARYYRNPPDGRQPRSVAVVAVDPSSPFSGGALLGDRVRMRDLAGDPGVFIRSMASRGALGGLARTTAAMIQALDAAGFEVILIETVGAGQAEVDIARLAHTCLVVEAPGMGDDIQAIKAGILEIADVIVINKADRPGADNTERALRTMLEFGPHAPLDKGASSAASAGEARVDSISWTPPIILTVATRADGIHELGKAIEDHIDYLRQSGLWQERERNRLQSELDNLVQHTLVSRWRASLPIESYKTALAGLANRSISPHQALEMLVKRDQ